MNERVLKKKILLAEDNSSHARLIVRCFDNTRVDITHQNDGEKVLRYLKSLLDHNALPDALLLDLKLPRVDGLEVLRRIKSNPDLQGFPVVILSSSDHPSDIAVAIENGADGYFVKPYDFDQMLENIEKISDAILDNRIPRGLLDDKLQQEQQQQ